jgi:hypothetical protein
VGDRRHNGDERREHEQRSGGAFHQMSFQDGRRERYTATVSV